jgi:hypothetical protein
LGYLKSSLKMSKKAIAIDNKRDANGIIELKSFADKIDSLITDIEVAEVEAKAAYVSAVGTVPSVPSVPSVTPVVPAATNGVAFLDP